MVRLARFRFVYCLAAATLVPDVALKLIDERPAAVVYDEGRTTGGVRLEAFRHRVHAFTDRPRALLGTDVRQVVLA